MRIIIAGIFLATASAALAQADALSIGVEN
jgi:hypothetical protein